MTYRPIDDRLLSAFMMSTLLGLFFLLFAIKTQPAAADSPVESSLAVSHELPAYNLTLSESGRSIVLNGYIDFGITKDLADLLELEDSVDHIQLHSPGGRIAEARGLVKVIERFGLATTAQGDCASACTLVFMAGHTRYLEPQSRLGFHRYAQNSAVIEFLMKQDPLDEQERDMAIFRKANIDEAFLDRIMATPHQQMWFPTVNELLAAGVVNRRGIPQ